MSYSDLLRGFISESSDLLDDVENTLVSLSADDTRETRAEVVNRVFRHFHSLKSSAGFLGLHVISRLTHEVETFLDQFRRDPTLRIGDRELQLLYRAVDLLRKMFASLGDDGIDSAHQDESDILMGEIRKADMATKRKRSTGGFSRVYPLKERKEPSAAPHGKESLDSQATKKEQANAPTSPMTEKKTKKDETAHAPIGVIDKKPKKEETSRVVVGSELEKKKNAGGLTPTGLEASDTRLIHLSAISPRWGRENQEFAGRFVSEAHELLEQTEQALLRAEQHPELGPDEALPEAMRLIHSIKGNSGLMGLKDIETLSHRMESELEVAVARNVGIDARIFDVLLRILDVLRQSVIDFGCGGTGAIPEVDDYVAMLNDSPSTRRATRHTNIKDAADALAPLLEGIGDSSAENSSPGQTGGSTVVSGIPEDLPTALSSGVNSVYTEDLRSRPLAAKIDLGLPLPDVPTPAQNPLPPLSAPAVVEEPVTRSPTPDTRVIAGEVKELKGKVKRSVDSDSRRRSTSLVRNDIRVDLNKLDNMLDLVGELVIAEAMVTRHPVVRDSDNESMERAVHQLRRVANDLQDMAMSVRMIPLATTFRRMIRLVYDLSIKAGKQVDLELVGENTEVDRTVIEQISNPMVHIIRNAIDHGIEITEDRVAAGKPEVGHIKIEGRHEGGEVWIVISDDGRGLSRERILRKAIERGMVSSDGSELNDTQIYHFIFDPGFSTAPVVSDISGRGVGMDVVRKNIEKLSGKVEIRTREGEGTAVIMRIPLTLAIIDGMLVRSGEMRYIIPLLSIRESLRPDPKQITIAPDGQEIIRIRDELVPIVRLNQVFSRMGGVDSLVDGILIVVEGGEGNVVALFADELLGQQETVIKGLSGWMKKARGISGCTILGDGDVGLILNIGEIVQRARHPA